MDLDDIDLQERLLDAFDSLEYLPEISAHLNDIKFILNKIYNEIALRENESVMID